MAPTSFTSRLQQRYGASAAPSSPPHGGVRGQRGSLTRIGTSSARAGSTGGLLAKNVPRPVQTSSLKKENGGQDLSTVLVNRNGGTLQNSSPLSDLQMAHSAMMDLPRDSIRLLRQISTVYPFNFQTRLRCRGKKQGWGSAEPSASARTASLGPTPAGLPTSAAEQKPPHLPPPPTEENKNIPWALHPPNQPSQPTPQPVSRFDDRGGPQSRWSMQNTRDDNVHGNVNPRYSERPRDFPGSRYDSHNDNRQFSSRENNYSSDRYGNGDSRYNGGEYNSRSQYPPRDGYGDRPNNSRYESARGYGDSGHRDNYQDRSYRGYDSRNDHRERQPYGQHSYSSNNEHRGGGSQYQNRHGHDADDRSSRFEDDRWRNRDSARNRSDDIQPSDHTKADERIVPAMEESEKSLNASPDQIGTGSSEPIQSQNNNDAKSFHNSPDSHVHNPEPAATSLEHNTNLPAKTEEEVIFEAIRAREAAEIRARAQREMPQPREDERTANTQLEREWQDRNLERGNGHINLEEKEQGEKLEKLQSSRERSAFPISATDQNNHGLAKLHDNNKNKEMHNQQDERRSNVRNHWQVQHTLAQPENLEQVSSQTHMSSGDNRQMQPHEAKQEHPTGFSQEIPAETYTVTHELPAGTEDERRLEQQQKILRQVNASRSKHPKAKQPRKKDESEKQTIKKVSSEEDHVVPAEEEEEEEEEEKETPMTKEEWVEQEAAAKVAREEFSRKRGPRTKGVLFRRLENGSLMNTDLGDDRKRTGGRKGKVEKGKSVMDDVKPSVIEESDKSPSPKADNATSQSPPTEKSNHFVPAPTPSVSAWKLGPPPGIKPRNVEPTPKIEQSGWTSSEAETSNTDNQIKRFMSPIMGSWPYSSFISSEAQIGGHGEWNDHHGHSYERNTHEDVAALPRDLLSSAPGSEEDASSFGKADIDNKALDTKNNRNKNRRRKRIPKPRPKKDDGATEEKEASQSQPNTESADVVEKKSSKDSRGTRGKPRGKPPARKPRAPKLSAQKEVDQPATPDQRENEPRSQSAIKDSKPRRKPKKINNRANTGKTGKTEKTEKEIDKPKEPKAQKKRRPRKPEVASTNE
eukprot:scaffold18160_cov48-Attheya_sp.AAC.1